MTSHLEVAAVIVWSLFMFFKARYFSSGVLCSLGLLTLAIPGTLMIPFIMAVNGRTPKFKILAGFIVPLLVGLGGLLAVLPQGFLASEAQTANNLFGVGWLTIDLIFSPAFIKVVSAITTGWLLFWLVYKSRKARDDNRKLLAIVATFLLLIPFAVANYFAFFYVWGSAVALMAILSHLGTGESLTESPSKVMEVSW
jgi:hypothetical protein